MRTGCPRRPLPAGNVFDHGTTEARGRQTRKLLTADCRSVIHPIWRTAEIAEFLHRRDEPEAVS